MNGIESIVTSPDYKAFFPENKVKAIRRKWDDLRRLKAENYYKTLLEYKVKPGAGTQHELLKAREAQARGASVRRDDSSQDSISSDDDESASLIKSIKDLDLDQPSFTPSKSHHSTPNRNMSTPTRRNVAFSPTPPPVAAPPSASSFCSPSYASIDVDSVEGTRENPFKIRVNRDYPEMNPSPISFCLKDQHHHGFTFKAWNLTVSVPHHDSNKWSAYFTAPNIITVKCPSINYFDRAEIQHNPACRDYEDETPPPIDEAAKGAQVTLEVAIGKDPRRKYKWYQFEIVDATLNNTILSGPSEVIQKKKTKVKSEIAVKKSIDPSDPGVPIVARVASVTWTIIKEGGIQTEHDEEDDIDGWLMK